MRAAHLADGCAKRAEQSDCLRKSLPDAVVVALAVQFPNDAYYGSAQKVRTLISRDFAAAFEQFDVLISPTTPTTAFRIGERTDDPLKMYLADLDTIPSNLAGNASMSVPCGLSPDDGLPVGLQVMAPAMADDRLYRVGAALEAALVGQWGSPLIEKAPAL